MSDAKQRPVLEETKRMIHKAFELGRIDAGKRNELLILAEDGDGPGIERALADHVAVPGQLAAYVVMEPGGGGFRLTDAGLVWTKQIAATARRLLDELGLPYNDCWTAERRPDLLRVLKRLAMIHPDLRGLPVEMVAPLLYAAKVAHVEHDKPRAERRRADADSRQARRRRGKAGKGR
jgi:hypothetical protein